MSVPWRRNRPRLGRQLLQQPPFLVLHRVQTPLRRRPSGLGHRTLLSTLCHQQVPRLSVLPVYLKPPLPSAKDITEALRFVLSQLDCATKKLEEDLFTVLKYLNCPIKLKKSVFQAPGAPHSWLSLLAVIHWLVQIAMYNNHLTERSKNHSSFANNFTLKHSLDSYLCYIQGDDDAVDILEREFTDKLQQERDLGQKTVKMLEDTVKELEGLRLGPSPRELLEKEKGVLEEDVKKFHSMIEQLNGHIVAVEKVLEEKEKELEAKVGENKKICEENEELKKRIESQHVNSRDAERMKRELQAVERDITDADMERNAWEEKCWDLDATIGGKFKELQALSMECNQAMRRFV
ncbi:kinetochore protein NDC80 homolog [Cornus florida]|uniref:kinetochore protein NDC80 homolog n=1 Tax=Cornus florida TaxID=4283 RepID=UPI0028964403|nr:kinetochore protein NDC80 homolog [Cornus florida]